VSTLDSNPRSTLRLRAGAGKGVVALGALVALGVMVIFLALTGANRATPTNSLSPSHSAIAQRTVAQYHSTGVSHAVVDPITGQLHGGGVTAGAAGVSHRAAPAPAARNDIHVRRSYGAVP
jgi:hypothetical protein